jgi:hypothetical protein
MDVLPAFPWRVGLSYLICRRFMRVHPLAGTRSDRVYMVITQF